MNELILMPTPNWFISRPIEVCESINTIATCAINSIIFTHNIFDNYSFSIKDAHSKRLNSLSFYENNNLKLIASSSEDLDIKVWDYTNRSLLNQHKLHQNTPTCIDWLKFDNNHSDSSTNPILISCDIKGNIFKWNLISNEHSRYFPENKPITQIKSCLNTYKIAVGYKHGTIVVLDAKNDQMKILHKLKNHEDSINCLYWCPKADKENIDLTNRLKDELKVDEAESILCSSSEDKTIRLWCTLKGQQIKCIKAPDLPSSSSSSSSKGQQAAKINFTPLNWPKPNLLITGSFKGELYYYDLLNTKGILSNEQSVKWRSFISLQDTQKHKKIIFDISYCNDKIVTLSLDRLINTWNLNDFKQESSMTTLNGFIYSISSSPIDPNLLAISVGDSSIKLISEKQNIKIAKSFSNNIKSEVTQISWHPTRESLIAFGTKDGKVGIADVMSNNKSAQYIYTGYNQSVYTLVWCENLIQTESRSLEKKSSNYHLYSVADGKIIQHTMQSITFGKEALQVENKNFYKNLKNYLNENEGEQEDQQQEQQSNSIEYGLTEFSVLKIENKNGYYFAIGKFDGSIEVYKSINKQVEKLCSFFNHQKLVTCIRWNTNSYLSDLNRSIYLASGSNDFNIILVDFNNLINELDQLESSQKKNFNYFSKYKHKLVGHKERITCLSWSKLSDVNLIASCSYDSTVQIWNADNGTPVANYRGHSDKLLCCLFSNNDSNIVYSGGEDYCLHRWRIDTQEFTTPPEECKILFGKKRNKQIRKHLPNKKQETECIEIQKETVTIRLDHKEEEEQEKKEKLALDTIDLSEIKEEIKIESEQVLIQSKQLTKPVKSSKTTISKCDLKSLFTLSSHGNKSQKSKLNDCLTLFNRLHEQNFNIDFDLCDFKFELEQLNLCLFCNRSSVLELLKLEEIELKKINYEKWWMFDIWKGNICKIVKEFRESKQLNDILFSLYQISTGYSENSIDLLNIYIEQLSKEASPNHESIHKAVLFSLASYQIEKAIDIYLNNNLYTYALCIAQLRLAPKNPYLIKVLNKYAMYSTHVGDYEISVMCYIRTNDFENAYKCLLRRNTKNDSDFEAMIKVMLDKLSKFMILDKNDSKTSN